MRDLFFYVPIVAYVFWLARGMKFVGNWTLYTTAILLFSIGLLVQYRLYSDPEYNARNKAEARAQKTTALRMRFIEENYDEQKKQYIDREFDTAPDPDTAVKRVVLLVLLSPRFLYREVGAAQPAACVARLGAGDGSSVSSLVVEFRSEDAAARRHAVPCRQRELTHE